jgi:iron complex outermembrane receptor protein
LNSQQLDPIKAMFTALLMLPLFSVVQAADELSPEQAFFLELPIVLTPSRLNQPLDESPNSITVIDREMIKASGFRSVVDLFRLVPGMYVGNSGAIPFVSLNGVTDEYSRRMQVLVDGRSVYLPPFGGVDWKGLPLLLEDIERIEVVRGPSAASHGTNSFYGVINIITMDAASTVSDRLSVSKGSIGISNVSAQQSGKGERFDYRLSYAFRADDGGNPSIVNDVSRNNIFSMRSNFRAGLKDNVEFLFGLNNGEFGLGTFDSGINNYRTDDRFRVAKTQNDFQQVSWVHSWEPGEESKLSYYRISRDYIDPLKALNWNVTPAVYGADRSKSIRHDLEIQNTTNLGRKNRLVWGGGFRYDFSDQPLIFTTTHAVHQSRVFIHDEWRPLESTVLNIGTMYEDDGAGHQNNSPRISLNYHIQPQQTFRVSYSTATRNAMIVERFLASGANQYYSKAYSPAKNDLLPEKVSSREIGYVGQFGRLSLDGRLYYEKVSNIILLDVYADLSNLADPKSGFKNLSEGSYKGLDVSAAYRWDTGRVNLNYARQQASCAFGSYPTQYFNTLQISATQTLGQKLVKAYQDDYLSLCNESVPTNSGSVLLNQQLSETVDFSTGIYFRDSVRVTDVASGLPVESPMRRVDMRLAKSFGQKERPGGGEVAVVLQNAFQDNYTGYGNISQRANLLFKRRAYLTASVNF